MSTAQVRPGHDQDLEEHVTCNVSSHLSTDGQHAGACPIGTWGVTNQHVPPSPYIFHLLQSHSRVWMVQVSAISSSSKGVP
jgi:hypothetical protein